MNGITGNRGEVWRAVVGLGFAISAIAATAQPIEILDYYETAQPDDEPFQRAATDGNSLFVKVPSSIVGLRLGDLANLTEWNRIAPASPGMTTTGRLTFDVTDGFLYVLRQEAGSRITLHVYDARPAGVLSELQSVVVQPANEITGWWSSFDDPPPMAIDAVNNLLITAVASDPTDVSVRRLDVFDITRRDDPRWMRSVTIDASVYRKDMDLPVLDGIDQNASKLIYRDGKAFWMVSTLELNRVDFPSLGEARVRSYFREESDAADGLLADISLTKERLFVTRHLAHVHPDANRTLAGYGYWDVSLPAFEEKAYRFAFPFDTDAAPVNFENLGDRLYTFNGYRPVADALLVFDEPERTWTRQIAGGVAVPIAIPRPELTAQAAFGAKGVLLRDGVTLYELPGSESPILRFDKSLVVVPVEGGRVAVSTGNGSAGSFRWYLHDDPMARDWCRAWGRNNGESGEAIIADIGENITGKMRRATFHVYVPGAENAPRTLKFVQHAALDLPTISVLPNEIEVGASYWRFSVQVKTEGDTALRWKLATTENWVVLPAVREYAGPGTLDIAVHANLQGNARSADIVIRYAENNEIAGTLHVVQRGGADPNVNATAVQAVINAVLAGTNLPELDFNGDGFTDTVDLQIMINAVLGV